MRLEAIALRLEAIAIRLEAIAMRLEAIALRLEAIASGVFLVLFLLVHHTFRLNALPLTCHIRRTQSIRNSHKRKYH